MEVIVIVAGVIAVLAFLIWNLLRKVEVYEKVILDYSDDLKVLQEIIIKNVEKVVEFDANGHFQADDELGTFFDAMKQATDIITESTVKLTNIHAPKEESK
jgi:pyoverdine/dityrosine biosynthesis protein Dit1